MQAVTVNAATAPKATLTAIAFNFSFGHMAAPFAALRIGTPRSRARGLSGAPV
ncbi:MAG: hypothetical protein KC482_04160 [Dehalococcoidia bacterium]|nr:hypothetical protein [Dehalococcoidia bacterium]MCA9852777.1 hypothetical protein [Dehalococcoidia bacterium]